MNRLIIIGNGFDLSHGMETSYDQFLFHYLERAMNLARRAPVYEYRDPLLWLIDSDDIHYKDLNYVRNKFKRLVAQKRAKVHPVLYSMFEAQASTNWADVESIYYQSMKKAILKEGDEYRFDETQLVLANSFIEYLKIELLKYLKEISHSNPPNAIEGYYSIFSRRSERTCVLNFNYTDTILLYAQYFNSSLEILNIHGQLDDAPNSVIFGYGNEKDYLFNVIKDLNDDRFFSHIKSFRYLETTTYHKLLDFLDSRFEIEIIGHSCGLSDGVLLKTLFEHQNCISIAPYYHVSKENYTARTYNISRHFNNMGEFRSRVKTFSKNLLTPQKKTSEII